MWSNALISVPRMLACRVVFSRQALKIIHERSEDLIFQAAAKEALKAAEKVRAMHSMHTPEHKQHSFGQ